MSDNSVRAKLVAMLLVSFILHASLAGSIVIRSAHPDIALTTLLVSCLFVGSNGGASLGTLAGLLEASYTNRYVGSIMVSRTITGWVIGALEERIFRDSILITISTVLLGTFASESLFFLFAPQPHALRWLVRTSESSLYNAVLAIPMYYLVRKLVKRKD